MSSSEKPAAVAAAAAAAASADDFEAHQASSAPPSSTPPAPAPLPTPPSPLHYVDADPYPWPYDGNLRQDNTCLIVIDMQVDFCGYGGYVDRMGYDVSLTRKPVEPISRVLECVRLWKNFTVVHTREGHLPDLSDCPPNKLWRSRRIGAGIGTSLEGPGGSRILIRGEPGHDIIPELKPLPSEIVIDKPGKGSFVGTSLDLILRSRGICNIVRPCCTQKAEWMDVQSRPANMRVRVSLSLSLSLLFQHLRFWRALRPTSASTPR